LDELVSINGLKYLVMEYQLQNYWHFFEVTNAATQLEKSYHHFITDNIALGDLEFQRMVAAIGNHFL